jgi:hypothetical protein
MERGSAAIVSLKDAMASSMCPESRCCCAFAYRPAAAPSGAPLGVCAGADLFDDALRVIDPLLRRGPRLQIDEVDVAAQRLSCARELALLLETQAEAVVGLRLRRRHLRVAAIRRDGEVALPGFSPCGAELVPPGGEVGLGLRDRLELDGRVGGLLGVHQSPTTIERLLGGRQGLRRGRSRDGQARHEGEHARELHVSILT